MLPFLRLCAAALAAGAVLAAPAAAQAPVPTPVAPADGATAQAGTPLSFTARGQGALVVRVARSPAVVDACGAIAEDGGRFDGTPVARRPDARAVHRPRRPRRGRVVLAGRRSGRAAAPGRCAASRWSGRARRRRPRPGHRRSARRRRRRAGCPSSRAPRSRCASARATTRCSSSRWARARRRSRAAASIALVRNSARRWRLDARGPSSASPAWATGTTTSASPPPSSREGALGTTTLLRQNYVRVRRVCAAAGCRTTRTPLGTRIVERDLALLPDVPWAQGPAHPTERGVRPRDRGPARARPLGRQPAPHPGRLPRHADGQGPWPGRVVALAERLALRRLRPAAAPARRAPSTSRRSPRRGHCITERVVEQTVVVR